MKGSSTITNPLEIGHSSLMCKSNAQTRSDLELLVAHISENSLEDDSVLKLFVPDGTSKNRREIDITVSDVLLLYVIALDHQQVRAALTDLRSDISMGRTSERQALVDLTTSVIERFDKMLEIGKGLVPTITKLKLEQRIS